MNFALLWIDALVVSLLWVATLAACVGRLQRRWLRALLVPLVVGPPLFILGTFAFGATVMRFVSKLEPDWFGYALSLLLAYLISAAVILRQSRRREPGLAPAAAAWGRVSLSLSLLIAAAVGYMTLLNMDFAIRARGAVQSVEVNSIYLATLPAITSDSQNAAPLYEKAFARLKDDPPSDVNNPPIGNAETFDPGEPATIAYLARQDATIKLLRQAAALPGCRFDSDLLDPDITAMLASQNYARAAACLLELHAREDIAHGHIASAIADAAAIFGMSRHLGQRPMLVSALVGIGIDALGVRTLQETLSAVKTPDELSAVRLGDLPPLGRTLQQALRGEERYGLLMFGNMPGTETRTVQGKAAEVMDTRLLSSGAGLSGAFFRVFFLDSDAYIRLMENFQELSIEPYYQARDKLTNLPGSKDGRRLLMSIFVPSLSRAFETCARAASSDACAQAAVAMTRFRLDHGTFPPHLTDLVPAYLDAVPTDPFDGHPLRLAIKANRWIIYSIGPDGIDNGGAEMVQGKGDITFTLNIP